MCFHHLQNEDDGGEWEVVIPKSGRTGNMDPSRQAKLSPTAISEIFGGQLRMELKITGKSAKKTTSANLQSFFTLPLDIQVRYFVASGLSFMLPVLSY